MIWGRDLGRVEVALLVGFGINEAALSVAKGNGKPFLVVGAFR